VTRIRVSATHFTWGIATRAQCLGAFCRWRAILLFANKAGPKEEPSRVQIVSSTAKSQILDARLAIHCPWRHVIELKESTRAATPAILRAKRALSFVT
jgi:hypothetical protein